MWTLFDKWAALETGRQLGWNFSSSSSSFFVVLSVLFILLGDGSD
jgi:hypothetical protein